MDTSAADSLTVSVASATIDTLGWTGAVASLNNNRSITLDPAFTPFSSNNDSVDLSSSEWCQPSGGWTGGGGRKGSPGYENVSCNTALIDVDGDIAKMRSKILAVLDDGSAITGQYLDEARRTDDGWRLTYRLGKPFPRRVKKEND